MAFTFAKATKQQELTEKAQEWAMKNHNVVFAAEGEGMGMDCALVSFHKNFSDFSSFITDLRVDWAENLQDLQSFLMTADRERKIKPFSLKYLEKAKGEET